MTQISRWIRRIRDRYFPKHGFWSYRLSRLHCFFVGHEARWGGPHQSDYCDRCLVEEPDELATIPYYLNIAYSWLVRKNWNWFIQLDEWMIHKYPGRLPRWWEY